MVFFALLYEKELIYETILLYLNLKIILHIKMFFEKVPLVVETLQFFLCLYQNRNRSYTIKYLVNFSYTLNL